MGIIEKCPATTGKSKHKRCSKNTNYLPQLERIKDFFKNNNSSQLICFKYTDIRILNSCWPIDVLFDSQDIQIVKKDYCEIFGENVQFLTCDPSQWPKPDIKQLTLKF